MYTVPISILVLCYDRQETVTNYASALLFNPTFILERYFVLRGISCFKRSLTTRLREHTRALVLRAHAYKAVNKPLKRFVCQS